MVGVAIKRNWNSLGLDRYLTRQSSFFTCFCRKEMCTQEPKLFSLGQGCQTLVLEGCCPAGFRCFPASTHLIQIKWISSKDRYILHKPANEALIWIRCVGTGKYLKPAGQRPLRTGVWHPCFRPSCFNLGLIKCQPGADSGLVKQQRHINTATEVNNWNNRIHRDTYFGILPHLTHFDKPRLFFMALTVQLILGSINDLSSVKLEYLSAYHKLLTCSNKLNSSKLAENVCKCCCIALQTFL